MDKFYNDIKPYGELLLSKHIQNKPTPVDIDDMVEYGLYWINNYSLFTKVPIKSTVIMSTDDFKKLFNE